MFDKFRVVKLSICRLQLDKLIIKLIIKNKELKQETISINGRISYCDGNIIKSNLFY